MTTELHIQLSEDYEKLSNLSQMQKLSDKEIFAQIAEMDRIYGDYQPHYFSFDGLISNLGHDQGSVTVLNYAIKRLKDKLRKSSNNKFIYDLANTILGKADVLYEANRSIEWLVDNLDMFHEARSEFLKVELDDLYNYQQASTNTANILEKLGRNHEALHMYDRAIRVDPSFGMALGNKAIALEYYIRLTPQLSLALLHHAYLLLEQAVKDSRVSEIGGAGATAHFNHKLHTLHDFLEEVGYDPSITIKIPKMSRYHHFVLKNNLFLNYDFGYYYDKSSLRDTLFPTLVEEMLSEQYVKNRVMSKKIYFTFQIFNQLLEDFSTARYNYYSALCGKHEGYDKYTNYVYTLDYTRHSLKYGLLKSAFSMLCNCLDKLAHLVRYYLDKSEVFSVGSNIYFDWFTSNQFKNAIVKFNNFQLLALRSLAMDFKENNIYHRFKYLRNRVTHSFVNVNVGIGYDNEYDSFEITDDDLTEQLKQLFMIVKSAMLYAVIGISKCHSDGPKGTMTATMQNQIFSR
jgi:tetratricopeptide (TPR) repeat protein